MAADAYPDDALAGSACKKYHEPFAVSFDQEQFLVFDDSEISPLDKGIDHFSFINGSCPEPPAPGEPPIVAVPQNRFRDKTQTKESIDEQLAIYTEEMEFLRNESLSYETNFYSSHRPIFAIACNATTIVTLDWTVQESLAPDTLDRVSAAIGGHMHWLEALSFVNDTLPHQIVVGNGGTKLIENYVNQDAIPGVVLEVGRDRSYTGVVEKGITSSAYGFGIMERNDETGDYDVTFYNLDMKTQELVDVDFAMTIRKGPRVKSTSDSPDDDNSSATEAPAPNDTSAGQSSLGSALILPIQIIVASGVYVISSLV